MVSNMCMTAIYIIKCNHDILKFEAELISLGLSVAEGKTEYLEIFDWIMEHKI